MRLTSSSVSCKKDGGSSGVSPSRPYPCTPEELVAAIHVVHRQIVPLRCILEKEEDARSSFLSVQPDLEPVITVQKFPTDANYDGQTASPPYLEQLASQEVTKGMGPTPEAAYNKPLWRAIVLDDGWVMLIFHHVISDGSSRKLFVERLLESLALGRESKDADGKYTTTGQDPEISLQPGAHELLEEVMANNTEKDDRAPLSTTTTQSEPSPPPLLAPSKPCWPSPDKVVSLIDHKYNQAPSAVIPNASQRLRDVCRSNGVTVTSAIVAALALAVRRQMSSADNDGNTSTTSNNTIPSTEVVPMTKIGMGIDIRRHLEDYQVGNDLFGCYVVGYGIEEAIPTKADDSLWTIARLVAAQMTDCTSLEFALGKCRQMNEQMDVPMTPEVLQGLLALIAGPDQGRTGPLNVSNIGPITSESSCGTVCVDKLFSITSQTAIGTYAFMNCATVRDDLCVTMGSVWPIVSKERGRAMLNEFVDILIDEL